MNERPGVPSRSSRWTAAGLVLVAAGCGGASSNANEAATTATTAAATPDTATTSSTAPRLAIGAITWELFQTVRIDDAGVVRSGSTGLGMLRPDGALIDDDGTVVAHLDDEGWVWVGDQRSPLRVVGDTVVEDRGAERAPLLAIQNGELLAGSGDELERIPLVGFRAELAREILFVSAVIYDGMARAYGGG